MNSAEIVKMLIARIGDVNSVETHINMLIAIARSYQPRNPCEAMLDMTTYLARHLGHILTADDAITLATSVNNLDEGITSITL